MGFISEVLYTAASYISWKIPERVSYESQGLLFSIVFALVIVGDGFLADFINVVFYKGDKRIRLAIITISGGLFLLFFLGGLLGFAIEPKPGPPNNCDLKFEYYVIYNAFYIPLIIWAILNLNRLMKNPLVEKKELHMLKNMRMFFIILAIIFIIAIFDLFVPITFYLFGVLTQLFILLAVIYAYLALFPSKKMIEG